MLLSFFRKVGIRSAKFFFYLSLRFIPWRNREESLSGLTEGCSIVTLNVPSEGVLSFEEQDDYDYLMGKVERIIFSLFSTVRGLNERNVLVLDYLTFEKLEPKLGKLRNCDCYLLDSSLGLITEIRSPNIKVISSLSEIKNEGGKIFLYLKGENLSSFLLTKENVEKYQFIISSKSGKLRDPGKGYTFFPSNYYDLEVYHPLPKRDQGVESDYLNLVSELMEAPIRSTRNALTRAVFGRFLSVNLERGFPLLTTKKMNFKNIAEEMLFFLKGETDSRLLAQKGIHIWDPNTSKEFHQKVGLEKYSEGDMGPMYGFQWRYFNAPYRGCSVDYKGEGFDQVEYLLQEMIRDPMSRRLCMTTFNPLQVNESVLWPCHSLLIQFYFRFSKNREVFLDVVMTQRSADAFLGLPYNLAGTALLLHLFVATLSLREPKKFGCLKPGRLIISLGDVHLYSDHEEIAKEQLIRSTLPLPKFHLIQGRDRLENYSFDDFELRNYLSGNHLPAPMIA